MAITSDVHTVDAGVLTTADQAALFTARHEHRVVDAGHALPYEAPDAFADAVPTVRSWTA